LKVNWIGLKITDPSGKIKPSIYIFIIDYNPFKNNMESLLRCAKSRWKIENEIFTSLKNNNYNLKYSFGQEKNFCRVSGCI